MARRQKRVVVPLDDSAAEGLAWLSQAIGLGEDALAKRLLQATLNVIVGAVDLGESPEVREYPEELSEGSGLFRRGEQESQGEERKPDAGILGFRPEIPEEVIPNRWDYISPDDWERSRYLEEGEPMPSGPDWQEEELWGYPDD